MRWECWPAELVLLRVVRRLPRRIVVSALRRPPRLTSLVRRVRRLAVARRRLSAGAGLIHAGLLTGRRLLRFWIVARCAVWIVRSHRTSVSDRFVSVMILRRVAGLPRLGSTRGFTIARQPVVDSAKRFGLGVFGGK